MKLVDVHCHLNHEKFKSDLNKVLENAKKAGVKKIIAAGVNPPTNREVLELSKKQDIVECTFGVYPIDALNVKLPHYGESGLREIDHFDLDSELEWIKKNKDSCVGLGEAGLDYKWVKEEAKQKANFQKVIDLCEKLKKPIVVHSRLAEQDCVDMLMSSKLKGIVLHCFEGRKSLVKKAADFGMHFSIPVVIERLKHFEMVVKEVNINQLLTETDAPWLSPVVGERNEPANIPLTIKKIAALKEFTEEEVANNIFLNYQRIFT